MQLSREKSTEMMITIRQVAHDHQTSSCNQFQRQVLDILINKFKIYKTPSKDVIDSDAQDYAEILKELNNGDDVDWEGETGLEGYTTKIDDEEQIENDEYLIFKNVFLRLEQKAPQLYQAMTQSLTNEFTNVSKISNS